MNEVQEVQKEKSLRHDKTFCEMLQKSESNHFSSSLLKEYLNTFPQYKKRGALAAKIGQIEKQVISDLVEEVFKYFPFDDIGYGKEKCERDITLTSISLTKSMLMNDVGWLEDSVLFWMKTMIHSFNFPAEKRNEALLAKDKPDPVMENIVKKSRAALGHIAPCYATYSRMALHYKARLSSEEWALVVNQFRSVITILGNK